MELDPTQLIYIGIVASVLTQGLRLLASRFGYTPGRVVANVFLFVVSVGLAVGFSGLPEFAGSDPAEIATAVLAAATTVVGSASIIYNVLLDKVLVSASA